MDGSVKEVFMGPLRNINNNWRGGSRFCLHTMLSLYDSKSPLEFTCQMVLTSH